MKKYNTENLSFLCLQQPTCSTTEVTPFLKKATPSIKEVYYLKQTAHQPEIQSFTIDGTPIQSTQKKEPSCCDECANSAEQHLFFSDNEFPTPERSSEAQELSSTETSPLSNTAQEVVPPNFPVHEVENPEIQSYLPFYKAGSSTGYEEENPEIQSYLPFYKAGNAIGSFYEEENPEIQSYLPFYKAGNAIDPFRENTLPAGSEVGLRLKRLPVRDPWFPIPNPIYPTKPTSWRRNNVARFPFPSVMVLGSHLNTEKKKAQQVFYLDDAGEFCVANCNPQTNPPALDNLAAIAYAKQNGALWKTDEVLTLLKTGDIITVGLAKRPVGFRSPNGGTVLTRVVRSVTVKGFPTKYNYTEVIAGTRYTKEASFTPAGIAFDPFGQLYLSEVIANPKGNLRGGTIYQALVWGNEIFLKPFVPVFEISFFGNKTFTPPPWSGNFGFSPDGTLYLSSGISHKGAGLLYKTSVKASQPTISYQGSKPTRSPIPNPQMSRTFSFQVIYQEPSNLPILGFSFAGSKALSTSGQESLLYTTGRNTIAGVAIDTQSGSKQLHRRIFKHHSIENNDWIDVDSVQEFQGKELEQIWSINSNQFLGCGNAFQYWYFSGLQGFALPGYIIGPMNFLRCPSTDKKGKPRAFFSGRSNQSKLEQAQNVLQVATDAPVTRVVEIEVTNLQCKAGKINKAGKRTGCSLSRNENTVADCALLHNAPNKEIVAAAEAAYKQQIRMLLFSHEAKGKRIEIGMYMSGTSVFRYPQDESSGKGEGWNLEAEGTMHKFPYQAVPIYLAPSEYSKNYAKTPFSEREFRLLRDKLLAPRFKTPFQLDKQDLSDEKALPLQGYILSNPATARQQLDDARWSCWTQALCYRKPNSDRGRSARITVNLVDPDVRKWFIARMLENVEYTRSLIEMAKEEYIKNSQTDFVKYPYLNDTFYSHNQSRKELHNKLLYNSDFNLSFLYLDNIPVTFDKLSGIGVQVYEKAKIKQGSPNPDVDTAYKGIHRDPRMRYFPRRSRPHASEEKQAKALVQSSISWTYVASMLRQLHKELHKKDMRLVTNTAAPWGIVPGVQNIRTTAPSVIDIVRTDKWGFHTFLKELKALKDSGETNKEKYKYAELDSYDWRDYIFTDHIDGWSIEGLIPFVPSFQNIGKNREGDRGVEEVNNLFQWYQKLLQQGLLLMVFPGLPVYHVTYELSCAFALLLRNPGDAIFVPPPVAETGAKKVSNYPIYRRQADSSTPWQERFSFWPSLLSPTNPTYQFKLEQVVSPSKPQQKHGVGKDDQLAYRDFHLRDVPDAERKQTLTINFTALRRLQQKKPNPGSTYFFTPTP